MNTPPGDRVVAGADSVGAPVSRGQSPVVAIAVVVAVLAVGTVIFGFTPAVFASLYVGMVAAIVAVPYTIIAIIVREVVARRERLRPADAQRHDAVAARFALFRQRASLVTAIVMIIVFGLAMVALLTALRETEGTFIPALFSGGVVYFGVFALVSGVFSIIVNVPAIYSGRVVAAERHAIRAGTTAGKLILATTILSTVSWIAYSVLGLLLLGQMLGW